MPGLPPLRNTVGILKASAHTLRFVPRYALGVLLLACFALPANGRQGTNALGTVLGTSLQLTGGASNRPQILNSQLTGNSRSTSFYGVYPSLSLTSRRQNSNFGADYSFGLNHIIGNLSQPPSTHTASLDFDTKLSARWGVGLSDSFSITDALGTVNALNGLAPPSAGSSLYAFSPVTPRASILTNGANANLTWALDPSSNVSFTASNSIRRYSSGVATTVFFPNQTQSSGGLTFSQDIGVGESWGISYKATYSEYGNARTSIAQSGGADYSRQIGPNTTVRVGAGLTQVNSAGAGKLNYDANASIAKTIQSNVFSLSYVQTSTEQLGLSSTSTTRRGMVNWNRAFGMLTAAASVSAYKSDGTLGNSLDLKGLEAASNIGIPITTKLALSANGRYENTRDSGTPSFRQTRLSATGNIGYAVTTTVSISGGVSFQDSRQSGLFNFSQQRAFIALRYSEPNLTRFR